MNRITKRRNRAKFIRACLQDKYQLGGLTQCDWGGVRPFYAYTPYVFVSGTDEIQQRLPNYVPACLPLDDPGVMGRFFDDIWKEYECSIDHSSFPRKVILSYLKRFEDIPGLIINNLKPKDHSILAQLNPLDPVDLEAGFTALNEAFIKDNVAHYHAQKVVRDKDFTSLVSLILRSDSFKY